MKLDSVEQKALTEELVEKGESLGYTQEMIEKIIIQYGLMYAKGVILERAIPNIDGFKPSQRRVLYTMYNMGLKNGHKAKCSKIAGNTLTYNPHSDVASYMTMVQMTDATEIYNVPYVKGKGTFGKVYSRDLPCAKMRYPEAELTKIGESLFEGIRSGAVNFKPNFDNTETEPELLPVKFPTILVNPISGVAVAKSCTIPAFPLHKVCKATCGIITGEITTAEELADVLEHPEYTTGGFVHYNKDLMVKLCKTGKATFKLSGAVEVYSDKIIIREIPFTTTCEEIYDSIVELVNDGTLKEISKIHNGISINGMKLSVDIKRGYDSREVLEKLCRYTKLRDRISYQIKIIHNKECLDDIGVLDLLKLWIDFRSDCIRKEYICKKERLDVECHEMEAWKLIGDDIDGIIQILRGNKEKDAIDKIKQRYGMDEAQAKYITGLKLVSITSDNMEKELRLRDEKMGKAEELSKIISSAEERGKIIVQQLSEIAEKFKTEEKTRPADVVVENKEFGQRKISEELVTIKITRNGYIKRLVSVNDIRRFECPAGDKVIKSITCRNNEHLLVFTVNGEVHKVLVDDIDASRGKLSERIADKVKLSSEREIAWIDSCGDYSKYFNIIYADGKGMRVYYDRAQGKRAKYISLYPPIVAGRDFITTSDKFFILTAKRNAAYMDATSVGILSSRRVFRIARIKSGDRIIGVQPLENIPNYEELNIARYNKEYTVSIGKDILWDTSAIEQRKREEEELAQQKLQLEKEAKQKEALSKLDALLSNMDSYEDEDGYYEEY